jgi:dienelactone hydrolase
MSVNFSHLGEYSDWAAEAQRQSNLFQPLQPGETTRRQIRGLLGFSQQNETAIDLRIERHWEKDGVIGEELSWSTGFGPRTWAWLLRPAGVKGPLAGILALHDHGGFKYIGKEKIAEGSEEPEPYMRGWWDGCYGSRAWANALAKEGFVVLVHDTFLWGSRRFSEETMLRALGDPPHGSDWGKSIAEGVPAHVARYNELAGIHEHLVEKYCNLLGTTLAGVVSRDDRIALDVLRRQTGVDAERLGCIGLSGGGNRAALLMATAEKLDAGVIVGLMSTYEGLLDHNVMTHTWMLFPSQLARIGDWPDLAACRAPAPLLVQYDNEDPLFTLEGMHAADARLKTIYTTVNAGANYTAQFYPGPHKFDLEMQTAAFAWLKEKLAA